MIDVGAELSEKILKLFAEKCSGHKGICSLLERIEKGKATFTDVEVYGRAIGEQLAAAIAEAVTLEALPNGQMYYNIAEKILTPALKNNYELINAAAAKVQEAHDEKAQLRLRAQKADFPESRVSSIIGSLTDADASNEVILRRLQTPVQTVTESFWDDYVKENAKFRSNSGLRCYIVRRASANCCSWCAALAGRYLYGEEPKDVYRRHDNCTCTVTYENGRTRQNVWTKKSWESPETDTNQREPKRISYPQAKEIEAENMRYKGIGDNANASTNIGIQFFANKNIPKMSSVELKKSINSLKKGIAKHESKIAFPEKHYQNWNNFSDREKNGYRKHWEKEITNFTNQIKEAEEELKNRGDYDE